jgi:hypothetical protein
MQTNDPTLKKNCKKNTNWDLFLHLSSSPWIGHFHYQLHLRLFHFLAIRIESIQEFLVSIPITSFTNLICFKSLELFNVTHLLTSSSWGSYDMLKISSICVLMGCVHTRDFSLSLESTHYPHCSFAPSPSDPYICFK